MTSDFQAHGRALLSNGYLILPIKPGQKRPALENWQTARLVAYGAWLAFPPAGFIIGGLLLLAGAVLVSREL